MKQRGRSPSVTKNVIKEKVYRGDFATLDGRGKICHTYHFETASLIG